MTPVRSDTTSLEALLEEQGWIRRLARQLVGDGPNADDLAQETWVRMLSHPPRSDRPIRGWIATVMRNLLRHEHRGEERRATRESLVARDCRDESALLEKVTSHRDISEAVLELEEPYRTTILLRYFEEMSPARIAARQRVPVSTVKTRLSRGLAQLRGRLDQHHGGDRHRWLLALLPLARRPEALAPFYSPASIGAVIVNTKLVIGTVCAVVVGASFFAFYPRTDDAPPSRDTAAAAPAERTTPARPGAGAASPPGTTRTQVVAPAVGTAAGVAATTAPDLSIHGRVLDVRGRVVAGVTVVSGRWSVDDHVAADSAADGPIVQTRSDGTFTMSASPSGHLLAVRDARFTTVLAGQSVPSSSGGEVVVVVAPSLVLRGRVVDTFGVPIAGAGVALRPPDDLRARLDTVLDNSVDTRWLVRSDPAGNFAFDAAPAIEGAVLTARADGHAMREDPAPQVERKDLVIVLEADSPGSRVLAGVVVDAAGAPVERARVSLGIDSTVTGDDGRFRFVLGSEDSFNHRAARFLTVDESRLIAVKPGHLPGEFATDRRDTDGNPVWPDDIVLRLGGEPMKIAGKVVDAAGAGRAGVRVWVADPTFFGGIGDPSSDRFPQMASVENLVRGVEPGWRWSDTDSNGQFELDGLLDRDYSLQAMDPATLLRAEVTEVRAGRRDARIVLSDENTYPVLRGKVVDRRGKPVAGVSVFPMCDAFRTVVQGKTISTRHATVAGTTTDAAGRFELQQVPRDLVYLRLEAGDAVPLEWGRHVPGGLARLVGEDHENVTITLPMRCHFQVELGAADEADQIGVLDAAGDWLEISEFRGSNRREGLRQPLFDGHSNALAVGDTAVTLVLFRGEDEVRRVPLSLTPSERVVIRP